CSTSPEEEKALRESSWLRSTGPLSTIEFQRDALENANTNTEVLKNMGFAAKAMKLHMKHMDIDK
ncbi:hypothetical protein INR49_006296, partial [Caranx melampygus]